MTEGRAERMMLEPGVSTLGSSATARALGPVCPHHGARHMARVGPKDYACIKTGQIFTLADILFPRAGDQNPVHRRIPDLDPRPDRT